jgi:hypothetical protein
MATVFAWRVLAAVAGATQPNHVERPTVVGVVSVWTARYAAVCAGIGADQHAGANRSRDFAMRSQNVRVGRVKRSRVAVATARNAAPIVAVERAILSTNRGELPRARTRTSTHLPPARQRATAGATHLRSDDAFRGFAGRKYLRFRSLYARISNVKSFVFMDITCIIRTTRYSQEKRPVEAPRTGSRSTAQILDTLPLAVKPARKPPSVVQPRLS